MKSSSTCKPDLIFFSLQYRYTANLSWSSFEHESALHSKVNEAMAVYDDYVKSQTDDKVPKEADANKA